ncbi:MAG: maf protein [Jatrophihabitans sp.]|nr:maf protein [Jatrophihabitans sp.]
MRFVLASASPARLATLRRAGVEPEVIVSGVDESAIIADSPAELVGRLADLKAQAVADLIDGPALVLGCDSLLEFDGLTVGKPGSAEAAAARWRQLRGGTGRLHTGHCLIETAAGATVRRTVSTLVRFADPTDAEIERYCNTGEPETVAGAFTIDGLGGWFVEGIEGDPHNVVGVSLPALRHMLHELAYDLTDLGYAAAPIR